MRTMTNRPRPDDIEPMVPDMGDDTYRTDGGTLHVARSSGRKRYDPAEADGPFVPDLS